MKRTSFQRGDLVLIGMHGRKVYRVHRRLPGNEWASGRPMYVLVPAPDHPEGAKRLPNGLRRYAFDELRAYVEREQTAHITGA